jgi:Sulfotransferase domain
LQVYHRGHQCEGLNRKNLNLIRRKLQSLARIGMVRFLSGPLQLYVVNEHPKAGGTWVGSMLGSALGVPFPQHRLPALRSAVMHGHYLNPWGMRNVVVVWRDGRDVMVSWYHHCLFPNEWDNAALVERTRGDLHFADYEDVRGNLPAFIEYAFTRQRHPGFSWADFVRRWHSRKGVVHVRYEDLRRDTAGELERVVLELTGERLGRGRALEVAQEFSFARQAGRRPGEEDRHSFLRKGVVGDWRNHFGREARETFDRHAGEDLICLGYERDRSWVSENPRPSVRD